MANSLEILYEDNHIIVVNKKTGDIVQGDKTGDKPLLEVLKGYIKDKYNKPGEVFLGTVHRIDRPTSGVVLFARTSKSLARLNQLFQDKQIQKTYWAIVEGKVEDKSGTLVNYLKKNEAKNKSFVSADGKNGAKLAELSYTVKAVWDRYSWLEIHPKTGRHHQIRVQLAQMGYCIKGDLKYGAKRSNADGSIHLHARSVRFIHPIQKEEITIVAPAPLEDPLWKLCR